MAKQSFEVWYAHNEERISMELAESGATRELDYNPEAEFEKRYEQYLNLVTEISTTPDYTAHLTKYVKVVGSDVEEFFGKYKSLNMITGTIGYMSVDDYNEAIDQYRANSLPKE